MLFFYDKRAKEQTLEIEGDSFTHIVKSRRGKVGDSAKLFNFQDKILYTYEITEIKKKSALLSLLSHEKVVKQSLALHLGWCVVEGKTIEKTLPFLNELGVKKLSFIYSNRSQKNVKLNIQRLEKILINSSCQCGRTSIIELEIFNSLEEFLNTYPKTLYLNFGQQEPTKEDLSFPIIVGPEGGFSDEDLETLKEKRKVSLSHPLILRSESAVISLAAKAL